MHAYVTTHKCVCVHQPLGGGGGGGGGGGEGRPQLWKSLESVIEWVRKKNQSGGVFDGNTNKMSSFFYMECDVFYYTSDVSRRRI